MSSYQKLLGNSAIFAIGTLGSKIIQFLLVPLYTYYLTTSQYGAVDLVLTTASMLMPIVSVSIFEAVLRFIMEKTNHVSYILTNSLVIALAGFVISLTFYPLLIFFEVQSDLVIYMYLILLTQISERIFAQYARAIGEIKIFSFSGILLTLLIGIFNIVFLVVFKSGLHGYFLSIILANLIVLLYLLASTKAYNNIKGSLVNKKIMWKLVNYTLPLIPNSLMWWLINASSRYFIFYFVGIGANGLFSIASKIPSIVAIINQVFQQAWQISAIEEYDSNEKNTFYSNVFNFLSSIMLIGSSLVIIITKPMFKYLFASEYYLAWKIVPFLLLGSVFSTFSGFLGTNYIVTKKTKGVLKTSVYGGLISILLNFLLIPYFGITGAGISSMLSFLTMWIIRLIDTRKIIPINTNWRLIYKNLVVITIQIIILHLDISVVLETVIEIFLFIIILLINKKLMQTIFSNVLKKFRR